jgi:hypothetical protein
MFDQGYWNGNTRSYYYHRASMSGNGDAGLWIVCCANKQKMYARLDTLPDYIIDPGCYIDADVGQPSVGCVSNFVGNPALGGNRAIFGGSNGDCDGTGTDYFAEIDTTDLKCDPVSHKLTGSFDIPLHSTYQPNTCTGATCHVVLPDDCQTTCTGRRFIVDLGAGICGDCVHVADDYSFFTGQNTTSRFVMDGCYGTHTITTGIDIYEYANWDCTGTHALRRESTTIDITMVDDTVEVYQYCDSGDLFYGSGTLDQYGRTEVWNEVDCGEGYYGHGGKVTFEIVS